MNRHYHHSIRRLVSLALCASFCLIFAFAYTGNSYTTTEIPSAEGATAATTTEAADVPLNTDYIPFGYVGTPADLTANADVAETDDNLALTLLLLHHLNNADQAAAEVYAARDAQAAAEAQAAADAAAQAAYAEAQAKRAAAQAYVQEFVIATNNSTRTVMRTEAFAATEEIADAGMPLGEFRLTFYCTCAECNGSTHNYTASGTKLQEGRTIAVDPNVIPLGSLVYIDGYGLFTAEDTGGAIDNNKIDICVSEHEQALALGVDFADVYLLS